MVKLLFIVAGLLLGTALLAGDGAGLLPAAWVAHRELIASVLLAIVLVPLVTPWFR